MTKTKSINYSQSKTARLFHGDDSFFRGVMGPIGSGKSVMCVMEMFMRMCRQEAGPDGVRRSRWLVVRNTLPQLETTTIKTWKDWFPPEIFGHMTAKPPYTHKLRFNDVESEVIFLALDTPEDAKKLLSFECTGIWFNEARELRKEIIDAGTGRVGRYPSKRDGVGATWYGVIADTNPPDDRHWWYKASEEETPPGWKFWKQPSGLSDEAENVSNLPPGYYETLSAGKTKEWVDVYVHGKYGYIKEGLAVYDKSWNDDLHFAGKKLDVKPEFETICGLDCSGLSPAAVFVQRVPGGRWHVVHEVAARSMGAVSFAQLLKQEVALHFNGCRIQYWGDPAGGQRATSDERTYFEILAEAGILVRPCMDGFRTGPRIQAVLAVLNRMVEGKPALLLSSACNLLRKGFNGGYQFKKFNTAGGGDKYSEQPEKNEYSHVHEALQYALIGGGELKLAKRGESQKAQVSFFNTDGWI